MAQYTAPPSVSQNIARARSLVKRDEPVRAIDALIRALELFHPADIIGKARFEVEVSIQESVNDLSRHSKVYAFLRDLTKSSNAAIHYKPGEESKLLSVLAVLRKALAETDTAHAHSVQQTIENRKMAMLEKAKAHLVAGESPRGKGILRQLAEEFGTEQGILFEVGSLLAGAKLPYDAAEFLEQATEVFPKDSRPYALLVSIYQELREFEKAETVYLKVTKEFGQHPKTMLNLAKLYMAWNKKDKAFNTANQVLHKEPGNTEAKEILEKAS